jgi:hypothetical protein
MLLLGYGMPFHRVISLIISIQCVPDVLQSLELRADTTDMEVIEM